ncbi:MAG TPA: hypothetical protein VFT22_37735 [Kofleriaceae bacterium]|nr:hypothetical protein [Kofleriaceae bacterium]
MKKNQRVSSRKLHIAAESIRTLQRVTLQDVAGGLLPFVTRDCGPSPSGFSCPDTTKI